MEPVSALHPPLRLCWPLGVESGLLPSPLTICVCSQDTEEALDVFIHDQTPPKGRASLPPSVSKKLPFYTHLPSRLSQPLEVRSGLLSSLQAICMSSMDVEEAQGMANNNQNSPEGLSQLPS